MILFFSAILSLLIGVVFGIIDSTKKSEQSPFSKVIRIAEKSLIYGILGLALTTTISIIAAMAKVDETLTILDKSLKESDKYYKARESINQIESQTIQTLFTDGLGKITEQLEEISSKKMYIPRERIWKVWETLIEKSSKEVLATNLVSKEDWKHVSRDGTGFELQKEAINRRVKIKRVFIYEEENSEYINGLYSLAKIQGDVGIEIRFVQKKDLVTNSTVQEYLKDLQGILDVVITDGQSILLTEIESYTYVMRWSYLSYDKKNVEKGIHFWEQAWKAAMELDDFKQKYSDILK